MIQEQKLIDLRAGADAHFRDILAKLQETVNTITSLEQQLQQKRTEHGQLMAAAIEAQAVVQAYNVVLDGGETNPHPTKPVEAVAPSASKRSSRAVSTS